MSGRVVFLGTAAICLPFLEALVQNFDLPLIITQPDKPSGRNRLVTFSCVKAFALDRQIPVIQPDKLSNQAVLQTLTNLAPDIAVVIAYGQWIPPSFYKIPKFRTINVHFSFLPAYRGAAPVQRAIQDGLSQTGVSIFELVRKMDAGPIWTQFPVPISDRDTTETMWQRMSQESAPVLIETVNTILSKQKTSTFQNEAHVSWAPMIAKEEGRINWHLPAQTIVNTLRAFTPWPGIFFLHNNRIFKVLSASAIDFPHDKQAGLVHQLMVEHLDVYCGAHSLLRITLIQPPGKSPMTPYCYSCGNSLGSTLE